ncbi:MAG TPA: choice-of-anchor tandem repeat GloVer-containing protein, partial [Pirellulales bacterium]
MRFLTRYLLLALGLAGAASEARAQYALSTLATFNTANGSLPTPSLTFDSSGNMYGTTYEGGPYLAGTVFEIAAGSQALTTLVAFGGDIGGVGPYAGVTLDASGNLYGTAYGGADGLGIVYEIAARTHVFTTLATFDGTNGKLPQSIVTLDASGNLYGTTPYGGASGDGTVFEIAAGSHTLTTLVTFDGTNGASPQAGLTLDASGNLYGTAGGGANGDGTVFEIA